LTDRALPATAGDDNGKVIVLSTMIAGVAGGIAVLLNGRRKQEEQDALAQLVEGRRKELADLKTAVEAQQRQLASSIAKAKERGGQQLKQMHKPSVSAQDLADYDWSGLSKKARKGLERARSEAAKRAPADLKERRDTLKKSGEAAASSARDFGERAAGTIAKRLPELIDSVEAELTPRAREASERVAAVAQGTKQTSKEAAEAVKSKIDDARPEVEELTKQAKKVAAKAPDAFAAEFKKAEKALAAMASDAQEHAGDIAHSVEARSRESAVAIKEGGKDSSSLLLWSGIAAGVVYFAVLNDEQRQKVKDIAATLYREARNIYADIQGEDGEF
jgi:hypothetical protein